MELRGLMTLVTELEDEMGDMNRRREEASQFTVKSEYEFLNDGRV